MNEMSIFISSILIFFLSFPYIPQYIKDEQRIWLMLFELYDRHFRNRNSELHDQQAELYKDAEVTGKLKRSLHLGYLIYFLLLP